MSRTTQETNLQSAAARSRLAERAEPYYRDVQQGSLLDTGAAAVGALGSRAFAARINRAIAK